MAYQTGTATDIEDLVTKLATFVTGLTTTPWTQETTDLSANHVCFSRGNCYVSFRWDATTEEQLAMYQSLGFTSDATLPHNQPDDSGNGSTASPATTERRVNFESTGPFTAYHFFAGEGSNPYVHVVVEVDSGRYRHFGFGNVAKTNDWTGGEYVYGHVWSQATSNIDTPTQAFHSFLLDGSCGDNSIGATVHVEGLPGMGVDEKWGVLTFLTTTGTDTAGEARVPLSGGPRAGLWSYFLGWIRSVPLNAYKLLVPLPLVYRDQATSPETIYWLGQMEDVAVVNMGSYAGGDEVTVGSDTYIVFPWVKKQYTLGNVEESWNGGLAYKKIT